MTIRLLVTARDAAASHALVEIVRAALEDGGFDVSVHAQPPALGVLTRAGLSATPVDLPPAEESEGAAAAALLRWAEAVLADHRPDAVLVGLSTPRDGGIDEAIVARAEVPAFAVQDFWGEVNDRFGRAADCQLCLDETAVRLTRERHGLEGVAIGSPRHARYAELGVSRLRESSRRALGLDSGPVYGFFGQALHHLAGYRRTAVAWAEAVAAISPPAVALYRPHPRESARDAIRTREYFDSAGLLCRMTNQRFVEETLAACDVACSAFSLCNHDAIYLNRFAPEPLVTPMSLMFDPEVATYCREVAGLDEFPYVDSDLVLAVRRLEDLPGALASAASAATCERTWRAARSVPDPCDAATRAIDLIRQRVTPNGR